MEFEDPSCVRQSIAKVRCSLRSSEPSVHRSCQTLLSELGWTLDRTIDLEVHALPAERGDFGGRFKSQLEAPKCKFSCMDLQVLQGMGAHFADGWEEMSAQERKEFISKNHEAFDSGRYLSEALARQDFLLLDMEKLLDEMEEKE